MSILRTLISCVLLVLVVLITARFSIFTGYVHLQKEQLVRTALSSRNARLTTLTLNKDQLYRNGPGREWREHNREIVLDGRYFEVKEVLVEDSLARLVLIEDQEENRLVSQFFEQDQQAKSQLGHLLLLIMSMQCLPEDAVSVTACSSPSIKYHQTPHSQLPEKFNAELLQPPRSC